MTIWTKEKIEEEYKNGRRDFSGEDFSGLDLQRLTLIDADLTGAYMTRANLRGADLRWANLRGADLTDADLTGANLRGVDMTYANLTDADLTGADLDFSCLPLWCGSIGTKVDKRIAAQLCYHFCAVDCDDPEYQKARAKVLDFANQMHRSDVKRLK